MSATRTPTAGPEAPRPEQGEVLSFEEFLAIDAPERIFELVSGHLLEKRIGIYESEIASLLHYRIRKHLVETGIGGRVFDSEAIFRCFEDPQSGRRSDVSYVVRGRVDEQSRRAGWLGIAPDLVAEVISPNDLHGEVKRKAKQYLAAGVRLVWLIDGFNQEVTVMEGGGGFDFVRAGEILHGQDVLPGFEMDVAFLFDDAD